MRLGKKWAQGRRAEEGGWVGWVKGRRSLPLSNPEGRQAMTPHSTLPFTPHPCGFIHSINFHYYTLNVTPVIYILILALIFPYKEDTHLGLALIMKLEGKMENK